MATKKLYYFDPRRIDSPREELSPEEYEIKEKFLAPDPRDEIISRLDLEEAVKTLTPYQSKVWKAFFIDGYTVREIALRYQKDHTTIVRVLKTSRRKIYFYLHTPKPPKVDVPNRGIID